MMVNRVRDGITHWPSTGVLFKSKMALHWRFHELQHKYKFRGSASVYLNRKFFEVIFFGKCVQTM